jgi:hypothetical protein
MSTFSCNLKATFASIDAFENTVLNPYNSLLSSSDFRLIKPCPVDGNVDVVYRCEHGIHPDEAKLYYPDTASIDTKYLECPVMCTLTHNKETNLYEIKELHGEHKNHNIENPRDCMFNRLCNAVEAQKSMRIHTPKNWGATSVLHKFIIHLITKNNNDNVLVLCKDPELELNKMLQTLQQMGTDAVLRDAKMDFTIKLNNKCRVQFFPYDEYGCGMSHSTSFHINVLDDYDHISEKTFYEFVALEIANAELGWHKPRLFYTVAHATKDGPDIGEERLERLATYCHNYGRNKTSFVIYDEKKINEEIPHYKKQRDINLLTRKRKVLERRIERYKDTELKEYDGKKLKLIDEKLKQLTE